MPYYWLEAIGPMGGAGLACFLLIGRNKVFADLNASELVGLEFAFAFSDLLVATDVNKKNSVHAIRCSQPMKESKKNRPASTEIAQRRLLVTASSCDFSNCSMRLAHRPRSVASLGYDRAFEDDFLEFASIGRSCCFLSGQSSTLRRFHQKGR